MADRHIDHMECSEYGRYFLVRGQELAGAAKMVNMELVLAGMGSVLAVVDAELERAGYKRSDLRSGRGDAADTIAAARAALQRLYHYLLTLPPGTRFDFEAFFPGRKLGGVTRLKPADLVGTMDNVLRGFGAAANATLPGAAAWKEELAVARDALAGAVSGKDVAHAHAVVATAGLADARKQFLAYYNSVAKPAVRIALHELGRSKEFRLFFRDLQVNESRAPGEDDMELPASEPGTDVPVTSGPRAMA